MKAKEMFCQLGYGVVENSEDKIVYVKYDTRDQNIPKHKRACTKIIFSLITKTVLYRGRSERDNLVCPPIELEEFKGIYQQVIELGWI